MSVKNNKQIFIVGDRVLIKPDSAKERTKLGLYLPQGVETKDKVQGGFIVKIGPGFPLPDPSSMGDAPWESSGVEAKYLPLQAEEGDYALFLRKAGIEIEFDGEKYIIVSQAALLMLVREDILDSIGKSDE